MPAAFFKMRFKVDPAARRALVQMKRDVKDLRWAWPGVAQNLVVYHRLIFDTEGASNQMLGAWAPLAAMTVRLRSLSVPVSPEAPRDYGAPSGEGAEGRILHWSHRLRDAMVSADGTSDSVRAGTYRSFTYGVEGATHWPVHQSGGFSQSGRPIPARPFLDVIAGPRLAVASVERQLRLRWAKVTT